jgi:CRP/FNR family transcriptional regulator, cyclic AMP receptor protein
MDWISSVTWPQWFGYAAVVASVVTCAMKTMIPLRVVSMICNSLFIIYGVFAGVYPTLILNCILLPLNGLRLFQMRRLIADVERAAASDQTSIDWLMPYMSGNHFKKGEMVFHKGDKAEAMFYSVSGRYRLVESGIELPLGQVFGELGLISPGNVRTQTVECIEDGQVLSASYQLVKELYFQNPEFGFYFLKLTSERLFQNIGRLEEELARKNAKLAAMDVKPA